MRHAIDALFDRSGSLIRRLVIVASVAALIGIGVPVPPVHFSGSCFCVADEPRPAPGQHEAPVEDGDEEQESESDKESKSGSEVLAAASSGPRLDVEAGRFQGCVAVGSSVRRAGHGDLTIRGPPLS